MACHCCGGSSLSKISPGNNLWQLFVHEDCCILLKMYIFPHCIHDYSCRDGEELDSQGDASSQPDTISIASRTSQNTMDSDKVRNHSLFFIQTATHSPVLLIRTWFRHHLLASRHRQIRGWRQRVESYGPRYSAQQENPSNCRNCTEVDTFVWERIFACSDRSILVKSGINTTDGLSSYAQYEHRKHTHTGTHRRTNGHTHRGTHRCINAYNSTNYNLDFCTESLFSFLSCSQSSGNIKPKL